MIGEVPVRRVKLPLLKVEAGSAVTVQSLSDRVFSLTVHWVDGRSYVCPGKGCCACPEWDARYVGFLYVRLLHGNQPSRRFLLEISATTYDRAYGLMRMDAASEWLGQVFDGLWAKKRGPLVLEPMGLPSGEELVAVDPMRVWDALATLYSLPCVADGEDEQQWADRAAQRANHVLQLAIDRAMRTT